MTWQFIKSTLVVLSFGVIEIDERSVEVAYLALLIFTLQLAGQVLFSHGRLLYLGRTGREHKE